MKIKQHYLTLILAFCILSIGVQAQNLTEFDKSQIVRRAKLKMDEFEELLFLISDPTRSRGAVDRYILSSYSEDDSLFNQVFYNKEVMIEDDISPIVLTKDNIEVSAIDVAAYLNNFKLQYTKYIEKTVFFTDLTFSDVTQKDDVYVVVSYDSEFKGKNANFKDYTYQAVKRKATLRAEYDYQSDAWQVWIVGVNFDREASKPVMIANEPKTDIAPVTVIQEDKKLSNESTTLPQQADENLPGLQFTSDIPESIKKGKSLPLKWNNPVDDASMSLYQGEQEIMTLRKGLNGQQWNWNIQQKPGKNYSLMLSDPNSNRRVKSELFSIKRKTSIGLYVGAAVGAAAIIYLLMDKPCNDCEESLAKPPGLPTN